MKSRDFLMKIRNFFIKVGTFYEKSKIFVKTRHLLVNIKDLSKSPAFYNSYNCWHQIKMLCQSYLSFMKYFILSYGIQI